MLVRTTWRIVIAGNGVPAESGDAAQVSTQCGTVGEAAGARLAAAAMVIVQSPSPAAMCFNAVLFMGGLYG